LVLRIAVRTSAYNKHSSKWSEATRLCQLGDGYRLYSADLAFRVLATKGDKTNGICTLDILAGLEEAVFRLCPGQLAGQ